MVAHIGADRVSVNVNGVGYEAQCSGRTLGKLQADAPITLHIYTYVREDQITLFGFADITEKDMFLKLISINGVGPKAGLSILATLSPTDITEAILTQNGKAFTRANGIGGKTGERIVLELKNKLGSLSTLAGADEGGVMPISAATPAVADVLSALMNMGFKENQAQTAVAKASKNHPEANFDVLLKSSLQELR